MCKRGQSLLEYTILTIILLGAFVATQNYVKRGIQGRWRASVDELGDQYDPRTTNSLVTSYLNSVSSSVVSKVTTPGGDYTSRNDTTQSNELKSGNTAVGSI